ncbi:MAG: Flp family type IVb pilin [Pirellula sp.]|jgi:Flp pilus assembly pilin Flp
MDMQHKNRAIRSFRRFLENDEGSSTMEYATMLGVICATLFPVIQSLGEKVSGVSRKVTDAFASAAEDPPLPTQPLLPAPEDPSLQ